MKQLLLSACLKTPKGPVLKKALRHRTRAFVFAALLCGTAELRAVDWDVQTVHAAVPKTYPVAPTLAGGPAGSMHLSYVLYGPVSNGLYHAEQPFGGSWQTSQVLPDPRTRLASLLASTVDSSGAPHLISYDYGEVQYSVRTGAGWSTEAIPESRGLSVDPGRSAFNTGTGPRFVFWDDRQGRLQMHWKTGGSWSAALNTAMRQYTNGHRVSAVMDAPDAGTEILAVFHDGEEPGNLRISRWDGSRWEGDSVVAENVDARAPFSATLVTTFDVRYVYVVFTRSTEPFQEELFVTRRPLSAIPNTWNEIALTNVYELQFERLTIRAGNFHVAIGYHSFRLPQLLLAETAAGFESMGNLESQEVPVTGNVDDFDMAIHNGNLWFAVSTATLRTLEVARLQLPGGNIPPEGRLLPNTIVYSALTGASFEFLGEVGRSYRIEYIENLGSQIWMPLTNFVYATPMRITDTQAGGRSRRWYRAVSP